MDQSLLVYMAGAPLLGVAAQWLAWRLRLPAILVLLCAGVALGQALDPDKLLGDVLFPFVSLAVAIILFDGGLTLRVGELWDEKNSAWRPEGAVVLRLVTLGAAVTWGLSAPAAWLLFDLPWGLAALLGAILIVTGPTVIGPMLRYIRPRRGVGAIAKWEGIVIDVVGAVLAVLVFENFFTSAGGRGYWEPLMTLVRTLFIGCGLGWITGLVLVELMKRYWLPDFLHGVAALAVALGAFALANSLQHEAGLATVIVLGVALANQRRFPVQHIAEFKENLGVFLLTTLFIVLGSRLKPLALFELGWRGPAFLAFLVFVARPAAVFLSTWGAALHWREKTLLAFLAPRGIVAASVASVFALKLVAAGDADTAAHAQKLAPIIFLVIFGSVLVYGLGAAPLARWLGLADANPQGLLIAGADGWVRQFATLLRQEGVVVRLLDTNHGNCVEARLEGLDAVCASVLSDYTRNELDLAGVGRFLALTSNNEVNALAVRELTPMFGRANVFQLPPPEVASRLREPLPEHLRGRLLFARELTHAELEHRLTGDASGAQDWVLKKTRLTKEFTLADFHKRHGDSAFILCWIDDAKKVALRLVDQKATPRPGSVVIALVET